MTFGTEKSSTAAVQFEPHLMISAQKEPTVKKVKASNILPRASISKWIYIEQKNLKVNLTSICTKLTDFHLNHSIKFALSTLTFAVKLKWEFGIIKTSIKLVLYIIKTWVKQQHWLNLHPGANIAYLKQSTSKLWINLSLVIFFCQFKQLLEKFSRNPKAKKFKTTQKIQFWHRYHHRKSQ